MDTLFYEFSFSLNPSENQLIYSHEMRDMMHSNYYIQQLQKTKLMGHFRG